VGRSAFGPLVSKIQQRLAWSGILVKRTGTYDKATVAAVKRLQGKFFLSQTGVVNKRTMAEMKELKVKRPPRACRAVSKAICIDKTRKVAQLVVDGKVKLSLDARFGSVNSPGLATREGVFSVQRKAVHHISTAYHTSMPYSMFFSGGQAVHYSQYFAADGYSGASHGCVNIRDFKGVAKMYAQSPIGTRVVVYRS
jgi:peptidoglycan hydrolase-like protein with peptidoglycan-binding domain